MIVFLHSSLKRNSLIDWGILQSHLKCSSHAYIRLWVWMYAAAGFQCAKIILFFYYCVVCLQSFFHFMAPQKNKIGLRRYREQFSRRSEWDCDAHHSGLHWFLCVCVCVTAYEAKWGLGSYLPQHNCRPAAACDGSGTRKFDPQATQRQTPDQSGTWTGTNSQSPVSAVSWLWAPWNYTITFTVLVCQKVDLTLYLSLELCVTVHLVYSELKSYCWDVKGVA